jgi:hypothetical protein
MESSCECGIEPPGYLTKPLGSPRRRWEENISVDVTEIGINTKKWVGSNPGSISHGVS